MSTRSAIPASATGGERGVRMARLVDQARLTLVDGVYEAIKATVMDGEIEPGGRVSIDALARDLDVSPTPVREALVRLESDGLVVKRAQSGYRTTELLTAAQVEQLFELRLAIEPMAARLAAERATGDEVFVICRHELPVVSLQPGASYDAYRSFSLADSEFHTFVADASHNPMLRQAWDHSNSHLHLFRLYVPSRSADLTAQEHRSIADAIASRDGEQAAAAMVDHLTQSHRRVSSGLGAG